MAQRLFITVAGRSRPDRMLVEMPGDQPIRGLIRDLVRVIDWKESAEAPADDFYLETEAGEELPAGQTLSEAGITNSDILFLTLPKTPARTAGDAETDGKLQDPINPLPPGHPEAKGISIQEVMRRPRLVGPQGLAILLGTPPLRIGRSGKGSAPDIDLAEWDAQVICSRRHAVIEDAGGGFLLRPEKTTNGTFINGVEVPAGESRMLRDGDRIRFGFQGLELAFRLPGD